MSKLGVTEHSEKFYRNLNDTFVNIELKNQL